MSQYGANTLAKQGYNAYQILKYFYKDVSFARLKADV
jgi:SpoIID/LytB domain protein